MMRRLRRLSRFAPVLLLLAVLGAGPAPAFETAAREAFLIDLQTGEVLLEKDPDRLMPPLR